MDLDTAVTALIDTVRQASKLLEDGQLGEALPLMDSFPVRLGTVGDHVGELTAAGGLEEVQKAAAALASRLAEASREFDTLADVAQRKYPDDSAPYDVVKRVHALLAQVVAAVWALAGPEHL